MNKTDWTVRHNEAQSRFEVATEGETCLVQYRVQGPVMRLVHTEVAPQLEGRGIAGALVRAALDHARAQGLKVDPQCSYAASYMRRHPETQDLLA